MQVSYLRRVKMNLLFVCTANVSRSFLAERLMKGELERLDRSGVSVASAGLYARDGASPDPKMVEYLRGKGVFEPAHPTRRITKEDASWADRIFVMEQAHAETLGRMWPEALDKVELLGRYISGDGSADDIMDPYGRSAYHYRLAQGQITLAVKTLAATLGS